MNELYVFKATNDPDNICHKLDMTRVIENKNKNIETSIYFDLNILSHMKDVMMKKKKLEETELPYLINLINNLEDIYLSAGMALKEVDYAYALDIQTHYNNFCDKYFNGISDAYNAIPYNPPEHKINSFFDYEISTQQNLSLPYAIILNIHYINKKYKDKDPSERFAIFADSVFSEINCFDMLACTIAMLIFSESETSSETIKRLKKNFMKRHSDPKFTIKNSLNASWDLIFYRNIAFCEYASYDPQNTGFTRPQDTWGITADKGVKALSDLLFYSSNRKNEILVNKFTLNNNNRYHEYKKCIEELQNRPLRREFIVDDASRKAINNFIRMREDYFQESEIHMSKVI